MLRVWGGQKLSAHREQEPELVLSLIFWLPDQCCGPGLPALREGGGLPYGRWQDALGSPVGQVGVLQAW